MKHRHTRQLAKILIALLCISCMLPAPAAADGPGESKQVMSRVKSAFLLNFIKYTQWPDDAFETDEDPFEIVVLGEDPLGEVLDKTLSKADLHGRKLRVRRIGIPDRNVHDSQEDYEAAMATAADQLASSHLIYYAGGQTDIHEWIADVSKEGRTLTVGEGPDATKDGLMFGFVLQQRKLRFMAGFDAIKASKMDVSSRLLGLAQNKP